MRCNLLFLFVVGHCLELTPAQPNDPNKLPSSDGRRLFDSLMSGYNKLVRPVRNDTMSLDISLGIKLTQLIDVDEVDQVVQTNIWLRQEWNDYRLQWNPDEYGGMKTFQIPKDMLWIPDIVLYNNADGDYEITLKTKAVARWDGQIVWEPPAIYKMSLIVILVPSKRFGLNHYLG
ncbi:putative Acetylcholine receptor subunit alpha-like 1 [Hypsibius exemplaris]|uniref:Acetylcholine receptor subunit alpha-like 1 n=1 Tax=Hypsibius exemplaris TaxID=2072580 RepID=A0A1W0XDR2_HYPEX|nr:putative Acetylcholine receptor subunit alpha-like 1 [Hypsibius exemplaris]